MTIQKKITLEKNRSLLGSSVRVLVEGVSEETDLLLKGRAVSQATDVDGVTYINRGNADAGAIVDVRITAAGAYDLVGEIEEEQ